MERLRPVEKIWHITGRPSKNRFAPWKTAPWEFRKAEGLKLLWVGSGREVRILGGFFWFDFFGAGKIWLLFFFWGGGGRGCCFIFGSSGGLGGLAAWIFF